MGWGKRGWGEEVTDGVGEEVTEGVGGRGD